MHLEHRLRFLVPGLLAALLLAACGGSAAPAATSSGSLKSLTVGYEADATSLDPGQPTDINTMQVLDQMYDTLVRFSNGKLVGDLATSWKVSSDGLRYTFDLRPGVRFSNGDPLTPADVVFSFERMLDPSNPGYQYGPYPFGKFFYGQVASVQQISPSAVEFTLSSPDAGFLPSLTVATGSIVDQKVALTEGKQFALEGMGTGPFRLEVWKRGQELVLDPNPYYWGPKPHLRQITFIPIVDTSQRANELQSGAIDLALNPDPSTLSSLRKAGFQVAEQAGPHVWWIGVNISQPPFDNVKVRQALNYAINKQAITQGILYGTGIPADQPLSPGQLGYNSDVNPYPYDPAKARQLLAQAGYPHGFTTTLLVPTSGSGMQEPVAMGTAIQGYLKAVGVTVKIEELDWGTFLNKIGEGAKAADLQMWELSWMDSAVDPWLVLNPLLARSSWPPGFNTGFYDDPKVDALLEQGLATQNQNQRAVIYRQAEQLINQDAPWIFVDHAKMVVAYNRSVHGFQLDPTFPFLIRLQNVT